MPYGKAHTLAPPIWGNAASTTTDLSSLFLQSSPRSLGPSDFSKLEADTRPCAPPQASRDINQTLKTDCVRGHLKVSSLCKPEGDASLSLADDIIFSGGTIFTWHRRGNYPLPFLRKRKESCQSPSKEVSFTNVAFESLSSLTWAVGVMVAELGCHLQQSPWGYVQPFSLVCWKTFSLLVPFTALELLLKFQDNKKVTFPFDYISQSFPLHVFFRNA